MRYVFLWVGMCAIWEELESLAGSARLLWFLKVVARMMYLLYLEGARFF